MKKCNKNELYNRSCTLGFSRTMGCFLDEETINTAQSTIKDSSYFYDFYSHNFCCDCGHETNKELINILLDCDERNHPLTKSEEKTNIEGM